MLRTCLRSACSRALPQPGVWAASGLLTYSSQVGARAALPYYVLGCDFSMERRNGVRYLLGCATGRLRWFLLTTCPETMPLRIPVFSHTSDTGVFGTFKSQTGHVVLSTGATASSSILCSYSNTPPWQLSDLSI
jgi:hypothetical protein